MAEAPSKNFYYLKCSHILTILAQKLSSFILSVVIPALVTSPHHPNRIVTTFNPDEEFFKGEGCVHHKVRINLATPLRLGDICN